MALTKKDVIDVVCTELVISKKESTALVESVFEIIKDELGKGNPVKIIGFGKWTVKAKKERKGRNIQTGEYMTIAARKIVTFQQSEKLRDVVNTGA